MGDRSAPQAAWRYQWHFLSQLIPARDGKAQESNLTLLIRALESTDDETKKKKIRRTIARYIGTLPTTDDDCATLNISTSAEGELTAEEFAAINHKYNGLATLQDNAGTPQINTVDMLYGWAPIHHAARIQDENLMRILLKHEYINADIKTNQGRGVNAIHIALSASFDKDDDNPHTQFWHTKPIIHLLQVHGAAGHDLYYDDTVLNRAFRIHPRTRPLFTKEALLLCFTSLCFASLALFAIFPPAGLGMFVVITVIKIITPLLPVAMLAGYMTYKRLAPKDTENLTIAGTKASSSHDRSEHAIDLKNRMLCCYLITDKGEIVMPYQYENGKIKLKNGKRVIDYAQRLTDHHGYQNADKAIVHQDELRAKWNQMTAEERSDFDIELKAWQDKLARDLVKYQSNETIRASLSQVQNHLKYLRKEHDRLISEDIERAAAAIQPVLAAAAPPPVALPHSASAAVPAPTLKTKIIGAYKAAKKFIRNKLTNRAQGAE